MRLIDADALVSALNNGRLEAQTGRAVPFNAGVAFALTMVEYAPTIDAYGEGYKQGRIDSEADMDYIMRCKDCRYYQDNNGGYPNADCKWCKDETPDANDYCSCGERKDDEID